MPVEPGPRKFPRGLQPVLSAVFTQRRDCGGSSSRDLGGQSPSSNDVGMKISKIAVSLLFISVDVAIVAMMSFAVTSAHQNALARSHAVVILVAMVPFAVL